jgi:hypothetical protein
MSAAEIIEQIKQLSEDDRQKVREFFLDAQSENSPEESVKYIPREVLEKTSDEIFKKHEKLFRKLAE